MVSNVTCPSCGMENAYFEVLDEKGVHYSCPDCDYEWADKSSVSGDDLEEDDDDEEEEYVEEDDEEDPDDVFYQARFYTTKTLSDFFKKIIKDFDTYIFDDSDLLVIAKLHMFVNHLTKDNVTGYIYLKVKEQCGVNNLTYQEIYIDEEGLRLTSGEIVTGDSGPDSYSTTIFPTDDSHEALNIVSDVDNFLRDFQDKLSNSYNVVETMDCDARIEA